MFLMITHLVSSKIHNRQSDIQGMISPDQVIPFLDILRVAFPAHNGHMGLTHNGLVWSPFLPAFVDQPGITNLLNVQWQR